jgi:hypothetical protein
MRLSPPWGHRLRADFNRGPGKDGAVEVAGRGRCVQFGNDEVASKVWVAARAWLVGLSGMSNGFSCAPPCRCGVGDVVEHPCGNDDGQPWLWRTRSAQALHISLVELVVSRD